VTAGLVALPVVAAAAVATPVAAGPVIGAWAIEAEPAGPVERLGTTTQDHATDEAEAVLRQIRPMPRERSMNMSQNVGSWSNSRQILLLNHR